MKKILLIILPLLLIVGCSKQKEYSIDNIVERESIYYKKFTEDIVNGFVFKEIKGTKIRLGRIRNGNKDGKWTIWFENGQKSSEGTFKDGKEDGLHIEWHSNGQKGLEGTYKDGKQIGKLTYYNFDGSIDDDWGDEDDW